MTDAEAWACVVRIYGAGGFGAFCPTCHRPEFSQEVSDRLMANAVVDVAERSARWWARTADMLDEVQRDILTAYDAIQK